MLAGAASFASAAASAYGDKIVVATPAVVAGALAVVNAILSCRGPVRHLLGSKQSDGLGAP